MTEEFHMTAATLDLARRALIGGTILVVGGDRRDASIARLKTALRLKEVVHRETRESDASSKRFASALSLPGVLLAVAVRGHSRTHHAQELHRMARAIGLPVIDCYHIPHPNRLANDIERLRLLDSIARRAGRAA
jgi:hypothetical protein